MNEQLQAQYDALEAEKATLNPNNPDDKFRLTVIQQEQDKIQAQAAEQERLQRQAEEVATVELPRDYDAYWNATGANDEIRALVQQVKEYAFSVSNDEIAKLQEDYKSKLKVLQEVNEALAWDKALVKSALDDAEAKAKQAEADKLAALDRLADAESKRDNAVRMMEEAQAERDKAKAEVGGLKRQIDELEGMLRTYKSKASNGFTGGLKLTSTLPVESEEERQARQERERIEQINKGLARWNVDPLPLPQSPAASQEVAAAAEPAHDDRFSVDSADVDAGGLAEGDAPAQVAGEDATELTLEQKVNVLWKEYQARNELKIDAVESVA
ncbi:hypothetical protein J19TS2_31080 [Cohnella xylanilytica]|uniref:hypothetical protein n=1 Tax=Cohnella xylanilytica TaxID=557555 RepID=UPI001B250D6C|nr:hypothetical protein [Cohnella xylanilytica]GIO13553.1 hypothetical protein J19TS2_31080 [Cohnella xylanilytica]